MPQKIVAVKFRWRIFQRGKDKIEFGWRGPPWIELPDDELVDVIKTLVDRKSAGAQLIHRYRRPLH